MKKMLENRRSRRRGGFGGGGASSVNNGCSAVGGEMVVCVLGPLLSRSGVKFCPISRRRCGRDVKLLEAVGHVAVIDGRWEFPKRALTEICCADRAKSWRCIRYDAMVEDPRVCSFGRGSTVPRSLKC